MQFKLRSNKALNFEEKNLFKENVLSEYILPVYNGLLKSRSRNFLRETGRFYCISKGSEKSQISKFPGPPVPEGSRLRRSLAPPPPIKKCRRGKGYMFTPGHPRSSYGSPLVIVWRHIFLRLHGFTLVKRLKRAPPLVNLVLQHW